MQSLEDHSSSFPMVCNILCFWLSLALNGVANEFLLLENNVMAPSNCFSLLLLLTIAYLHTVLVALYVR
jgi:hypothetical protein